MGDNRAGAPIVVSARFARDFWPQGTAVGQLVFDAAGRPSVVVGVVADTQSIFGGASGPEFYRPWDPRVSRNLLLTKFTGDGAAAVRTLHRTMESLDANISVGTRTLQSLREELASRLWVIVRLIVALALVALLLAAVGIYGVVGFWISCRTKELGIRLALGASRRQVVALVFTSFHRPILAGLGIGLPVAVGAGMVVARVFPHLPAPLRPWDPVVFFAVACLLVAVAGLAVVRPALRITRIDPLLALRSE
jgi:ABC-type antimicrobial peptide transport system permease subunit